MKKLAIKKKEYKKSVSKGLRMDKDLYDQVVKLAEENGTNFNYTVNQMIEYGLNHIKKIK